MRLKIERFNPNEKEYVLPSSMNYRKADVFILKFCIIFALLAIIYVCPYKLLQPVHETSGQLQSVERALTSGGRHTSRELHGLYLVIDDQKYYLDKDYIFDDKSRSALRDVPAMQNGLAKYEDGLIEIEYLNYANIGSKTDLTIVGLEIEGESWIDGQRSMDLFRRDAKLQTVIWLLILAALIAVHQIRRKYTISIIRNH